MVTPELLNYVREQLKLNPNIEIIKSQLLNGGWTTIDVDVAINQAGMPQKNPENPVVITMEKPKRDFGGLIVIMAIIVLAGGGYYYWRNKNAASVKPDSSLETVAPVSWQSYSSISGSPSYTVKYSPDWEVKEKKDLTLFKVSDGISLAITRNNNSTEFSKQYESFEKPDSTGQYKLIKKSNFSLHSFEAQRYEMLIGLKEPATTYIIQTEMLNGTTRWELELTLDKAEQDNKANLDKYKQAYLQLVSSFQPQ